MKTSETELAPSTTPQALAGNSVEIADIGLKRLARALETSPRLEIGPPDGGALRRDPAFWSNLLGFWT